MTITNMDSRKSINTPVLTRISSKDPKTVQLVFDDADGKKFLAEVYIPGVDGFHLHGAPGKHTHTKVEAK